ncbi:MAG: ABC transporter permease subunit [Anaerolineae bacterium]|jgi:ABC-2 type transport system permease protein|nr:ABC transporter permease subunit [Anaerolineae bacterium]
MWAEYKNALRKMKGAIIGWSVGLFSYTVLMAALFPMMITQMGEQYLEMIEIVPKEFLAFFPNISQFLSPVGFVDTYFFSMMVVVIPILTIGQGAKLLVRDEEEGTLDLVMSYPLSRTQLFWARVGAYLDGVVLVLAASFLGWVIPDKSEAWTMTVGELLQAYLPLLAIVLVFGMLAFFLSLLLPSFKAASGLVGALLIANYLLLGISNIREELQTLYKYTPMKYYQGGLAVQDFNWEWFLGLLGVAILFTLLAWLLFERRDLRVGGEAGWELLGWLKKKS